MSLDLQFVCDAFHISGHPVAVEEIKSGHINTTYKMTVSLGDKEQPYIVQRINTSIFKNADGLMTNIRDVTEYLRKCYISKGIRPDRYVLQFLEVSPGCNYYVDAEKNYWRTYYFVDRSVTYDSTSDPSVLRSAGKAFGEFQMQLAGFDASHLTETIPNFHNTVARFETFAKHVKEDPTGRVKSASKEIDFYLSHEEIGTRITRLQQEGKLPLRVTHNDTKCNNVLFDEETNAPLAVIDLDTIMPGLSVHDFGDAIRFAANTAAEDEKDLSKVSCDLSLFRAFAEGFISKTAGALTETELANMALGAFVMTYECGMRFLDDYLCGDTYFRIAYPEHNLVRSRNQMALAQDMLDKMDRMNQIIKEIQN